MQTMSAPPVGTTRPCVVHRVYDNGVLVLVDPDDDVIADQGYYVVVLDLDQTCRVSRGDRGVLTTVNAGWRGRFRFDLATDEITFG